MEIRVEENAFVFEIKAEEETFTLSIPKIASWNKAKGAACAFFEEITRQEYRAIVADAEKAKADEALKAEQPAEEVAAEIVS